MSIELGALLARARTVFSRYGIASAALLLLVVAGTVVQYLRAPRPYVVTQQLQVVVLASGSNDAMNTRHEATVLSTALADPAILSSPRMANDVLTAVSTDTQTGANATAVASALTGSASGSTVTLSATWPTAQGAADLLGAAVTALQTDAALLPGDAANESARIQPIAAASPATRSGVQASALEQTLLQRILMALVATALLPFVLDALLPARRTATAPVASQ